MMPLRRRGCDPRDQLDRKGPSHAASKDLVRWHWSYPMPVTFREACDLWRMNRRHRRNLEQIEID
jgi:hypothetical protein